MVTRLITSPNAPANDPPAATYDCSPHSLAFRIGGQLFAVDPRDLISQATPNAVGLAEAACSLNLAVTDTPVEGDGFLFTWSLGVPFLKRYGKQFVRSPVPTIPSALAAFYYGNITHPDVDRPRIGLLSTLPQNASALLSQAVDAAGTSDGNLPG